MRDLLIWFFGTESSFGRKAGLNRSAVQIPPSFTAAPAPPEDSLTPGTLQPLKNWCHPFKDSRNPLEQLTHLANANAGYYPLGRGGLWHGGVHFDSGTVGALNQSSVHCLADGEVVAYRIDTHSPKTTYIANQQTSENAFSRNFVLVRHHLQAPRIEGNPDTPPSLTFFSLYMHLQDWAMYRDSSLARPGFWPERPTHRVKQAVNDRLPEQPERRGLNVSHKWHGQAIDLLPRGAEVTISGSGQFRKLENTLGPAALLNPDGSIRGYIAARVLWEPDRKETRVRSSEPRVNVRADPFIAADNVIFSLPVGAEVRVSGTGEFRKLEHINQYVQFDSLENAIEPVAIDQAVVLNTPVAIKAGDLIGHLGLYHDNGAGQLEEKLHLETFSGDDVELFIEECRAWAERLPDKEKTWLRFAAGTPVVTPEGNHTAALLEASRDSSPISAANLLVPKTLLDKLPTTHKRQMPATPTRKTCNWYHLEGLLHDANNTPLHGWVREEIGVTEWVSPWGWEGYEFIYEYDVPQEFLASFLRTMRKLSESQLERFGPIADEGDTGPLQRRLYDIIDRNGDGRITAEELRAALRLPAHAQAISQLIVCCDSEWYYKEGKWDRLDELLGHSGSTPNLNWFQEKRRIRQLSWWSEVAERVGLPGHGEVYHFHPVGLIGVFARKRNGLWVLGTTSEHYESGGRGPGVISTGGGDYGGVSYGVYQMSSNMGVVQKFIELSAYADAFVGLGVGTAEFNEKWKNIANNCPEEFRSAQHDYIKNTHYDVQMKSVLSDIGFPIFNKDAALNDMVWSTSVQFGPRTKLIKRALDGLVVSSLSVIEIIRAVQDYKIANNSSLFASSPTLQPGLLARAIDEKKRLLDLERAAHEIE